MTRMEDEDSIYRLLGDLSDFVKDRRIPLREGLKQPPGEALTDEFITFDEAMRDIQKMEQDKKRVAQIRAEQKAITGEHDEERRLAEALNEQYRLNVTNLPEYMEGCVEDANPLTMEKLRGGEYSVQRVLDLHGLRAEEAYEMFQSFIKDSVRSNIRCVKIIHGRGLKSKHEPVLKGRLKEWILRAMHRKWVIAFASSNMRDGGPGATNILLRQQPKKQKLHIIG
ncbi:MAG TPA: Smr/MutS family protein [Syntrophorhabdales bacterium]|nr:Smr/MutS family protein [Syntrophorhabdales bacterium]